FWKNRDTGAWSIPKGEVREGEDLLEAARREFEEELGIKAEGPFHSLGTIKQKAGKVVHAWAFQGDCDTTQVRCNTVEMEWPPRSGIKITFPEIDRAEFFSTREAVEKINPAQITLLELAEKFLHHL
ncbi:MAG: NUDIX domain-containing protein, partial [Limisphaerales bacterium]